MLHQPLARLSELCLNGWGERSLLNTVLTQSFDTIPHCACLYCLDAQAKQISDNVIRHGIAPEHHGRDRSQRPYMQETMPGWGFLLSDAYIGLMNHRPSLTALQVVRDGDRHLGYVGADFDLRDLPVTSELYEEPGSWRQVKGDPAIRGQLFQQCRVESPLDRNLEPAFVILEELLTQRDVFQCQIHFSSSQVIVWTVTDPFRYRVLDHEALSDPDICLAYPRHDYAPDALMPQQAVCDVLATFRALRTVDENIYLRVSSINLFNGMVSLTFSCDGSHYMRYDEFLTKNTAFWFGVGS
ncbi:MAG: PDC sensor domain-containing protein [Candidatus Thiodiazotropha sp.]